MKYVRKRQGGLQNRLLCFVSCAGGVSCRRAYDTLSTHFSLIHVGWANKPLLYMLLTGRRGITELARREVTELACES